MSVTSILALQWLPCPAPGLFGTSLGLVGPVSLYCNWVRWQATSVSVWQHVQLSKQIRPWDTPACCWDLKQPPPRQRRRRRRPPPPPPPTTTTTIRRLGYNLPVYHNVGRCQIRIGGRNSSAGSELGSLLCVMKVRVFSKELSFGVKIRFDSMPYSSCRLQCGLRSCLCRHAFHCKDSEDSDICVLRGRMLERKTDPTCTIHEGRM